MIKKKGKLTIFYGPMFSGKSNNLIETSEHSNKNKLIFKPLIDTRSTKIISRTGKSSIPINIDNPNEILNQVKNNNKNIQEVYIDEINFFNEEIINIINFILNENIDVFISGLDRDYKQKEFPIARELIDMANFPIQLYGRCHKCFKPSIYSVRLKNDILILDNSPIILVDNYIQNEIKYETWCKNCLNREKRKIRNNLKKMK